MTTVPPFVVSAAWALLFVIAGGCALSLMAMLVAATLGDTALGKAVVAVVAAWWRNRPSSGMERSRKTFRHVVPRSQWDIQEVGVVTVLSLEESAKGLNHREMQARVSFGNHQFLIPAYQWEAVATPHFKELP